MYDDESMLSYYIDQWWSMPIKSMKSMNAKAAKGLVVDTEVGLLQEIPGIVFGPQETPRIALLPAPSQTHLMTPG